MTRNRDALSGKVCVVTGASRGLGRAIAVGLARAGVRIALVARSGSDLHRVADEILASGGFGGVFPCDVSDARASLELPERVAQALGRPAILVNAAGILGPVSPVAACDPDEWLKTVMVNLGGTLTMCRAFLPYMLEAGRGQILNVSSSSGFGAPMPLTTAYSVSKAGVNALTRALAREVDGTGVVVNVLLPGDVMTDLARELGQAASHEVRGGAAVREWWELMVRTGGDQPEQVVALAIDALRDTRTTGGIFQNETSVWGPVEGWGNA
jgi:NAD(P)-dependent dehydrogenase (short-subunit alcohol dehydrogenase family)